MAEDRNLNDPTNLSANRDSTRRDARSDDVFDDTVSDRNRTSPSSAASDATAPLDPDRGHDANRDPLSGAPGAHPVGAGLGAAAGGAASGAATGAVIGTIAGPVGTAIGTAIGTIVGGIAGGYAGKGIAESVNPTTEDAYWRDNYKTRPYVKQGESYDNYRDAYEYGWTTRGQHTAKTFDEAETDLRSGWEKSKANTGMGWDRAKHAVKDSWDRITGDDTTRGGNVGPNRGSSSYDDSYWRSNYSSRPYYRAGDSYETYAPAYQYGAQCRSRYGNRSWNDAEPEMRRDYETQYGAGTWEKVKDAVKDSWDRVTGDDTNRAPGSNQSMSSNQTTRKDSY